ncbi:MAG: hypothetical protein KU29_12570 [Sulfurovum sp. FS06-10]|nr:MAG: hypothetical protein KU29_12570 [Sulfurovum sp. FS06-10]
MALPLITGIITIAGWFMSGGAVASFFAWMGVKLTSKVVIVGIQITTITLLFASRIAFLIAVLEFARLTLNFFHNFLNNLPTLLSSDVYLSLGYEVMRSIGLIDALKDSFAVFNVLIVAMLVAFVAKFAFHTAKITSDEFFKVGMLLQA